MNLSFTFVDLLVIGTIFVSAGYAAYRGLVSETLSIVAWAAAAFATLWFGAAVVPLAKGMISEPLIATVVAYAVVFLLVLIPLQFLSYRFSQQVKSSTVGPLDRALGGAFGVLRGLAIIGFAYLILDSFVSFDHQPAAVRSAGTLPLMQGSTEVILSLVPHRGGKDVEPPAQTVQEAAAPSAPKTSQPAEIVPKPKPAASAAKATKKPSKTYGARDRRALDTLLETTGGNSTP
jgi:uncharacterized membrane protein required for colicin V production